MDIPTSNANNQVPPVTNSELDSNSTSNSVPNSPNPFNLASLLASTASNTGFGVGCSALSTALLTPAVTTSAAMYGNNNGAKSPLNNFLRRMSSSPYLRQPSPLAGLMLPTVELSQSTPSEENPSSPEKAPEFSPESSTPPINSATSASTFFGSLGSPQLAHSNSSNSLLSGQMSGGSLDFGTEDQQQQQNLYLSYVAAAAYNGLFQNSPINNSPIFPDMSTPSTASSVFGQNNLCLPNIGDLFGQQMSVGQALGLQAHNAAVAGLFAADAKGRNGKNGNEQPTDMRKTRRNRTAFSEFQLEKLEECFQRSQYPDVTTREGVSKLIGLPESKVQVWLKNRRAKHRKHLRNLPLEEGSASPATISPIPGSPKMQKQNSVISWHPSSNALASLFPSMLSTGLSSPPGFDAKDLFSTQNLQRSIFENLMGTSQSASFSI
ncbi:homeobox domain-containing protein [Ditylenchus destructor]|uniref:Homeobox domain-containing protein n=1 Tax=Ditylenchus destructor TaxID=166010 RepID=A0AAD4N1I6_9BILA|nr:homeobox domain-containing protein [Ditylenchus destructor]